MQSPHMVFFLLQKTFGNEQGHINIFMSRGLETLVQLLLNQLPNGIAIGTDNHAAFNTGIIHKVCLFDNICVPSAEIDLHGGDFFNHFFIVIGHK